jgi:hypothetical protein
MAHFAQLDENNIVLQVIVVNNDDVQDLPFPSSEPLGVDFCQSLLGADTIWKQTSYNAHFRKNYAGIGFTYDAALDAFVPPQPYPSWVLNTNTARWESTVPYPNDGAVYYWGEATQSWERIQSK